MTAAPESKIFGVESADSNQAPLGFCAVCQRPWATCECQGKCPPASESKTGEPLSLSVLRARVRDGNRAAEETLAALEIAFTEHATDSRSPKPPQEDALPRRVLDPLRANVPLARIYEDSPKCRTCKTVLVPEEDQFDGRWYYACLRCMLTRDTPAPRAAESDLRTWCRKCNDYYTHPNRLKSADLPDCFRCGERMVVAPPAPVLEGSRSASRAAEVGQGANQSSFLKPHEAMIGDFHGQSNPLASPGLANVVGRKSNRRGVLSDKEFKERLLDIQSRLKGISEELFLMEIFE